MCRQDAALGSFSICGEIHCSSEECYCSIGGRGNAKRARLGGTKEGFKRKCHLKSALCGRGTERRASWRHGNQLEGCVN